MAYVTISTWKMNNAGADNDARWQILQDKYIPMNKALGATQVMVVQIGEGESAFISVFPNQEVRDAADAKIAELRAQGGSELEAKLTGEMRGEVRASSD